MKKLLFIIALITFLVPTTKATHIVGGELNYLYLGNDNYQITLTVYRDYCNGVPPFDNPAALGIFDTSNVLLQTLFMPYTGSDTIPPFLGSPCVIPPTISCYEVTTYIDTVNLPPISGGYQLAYQRCCRNMTIQNIILPNATGATYYATIPDTVIEIVNSNPIFNDWPPTFICSQLPFVFDHSATDPDGDSLYYELFQPFHGASQAVPMPQPPNNPPYPLVNWNAPYNTLDMLGGAVPLSINSSTGLLTATPGPLGQFVVGMKVSEYRNGVFLSETKRDYQFNIVQCAKVTVAALVAPNFSCESFTATFINLSIGAGSYSWDFGDPTTTNDTSTLLTPTYNYPDTGVYIVSLIAFNDTNAFCNDTAFGTVIILPEFELSASWLNDPCSQDVAFTSTSPLDSLSIVNYLWDFGDTTILSDTSVLMNPFYTYQDSGTYNVTLIGYSTANIGCNDTITVPITVFLAFDLNASLTNVPCSPDVVFVGNSSYDGLYPVNYLWDFGDPAIPSDTSNLPNLNYTYPNTGTFNPTLIAYTNSPNCTDTIQLQVTILPEFILNTSWLNDPCTQDVIFTANSPLDSLSTVNYMWDFGDPTISYDTSNLMNPIYTYLDSGTYNVTIIGYSPALPGCSDTVSIPVTVFLAFDLNASLTNVPCSPDVTFVGNSTYDGLFPVNYLWDFGDPTIPSDTSNLPNLNYTYPNTGTFNPTLIAYTNSPNCADTIQLQVTILPDFELNTSWLNEPCSQDVEFTSNSTLDSLATVDYMWNFGDPALLTDTSTLMDPFYTYQDSGTYNVTLIGYSPAFPGCSDTVSFPVTIFLAFILNSSLIDAPCSPNVDFTGNSSYDGVYPVNYFWDFGVSPITTDTSNNPNTNYSYPGPGTYNPILIAYTDSPACGDTIQLPVTIYPDFTFNYSVKDIMCTYGVEFTASSSLDGVTSTTYNWDFGDGNTSTAPINTHLYTGSGSYDITITINTANGCVDSYSTTIEKVDLTEIFVPNAFTPNGDRENDVLFVRGEIDGLTFKIYDRWGEKVFETNDQSVGWDGTYKGSPVDPGVFVYHLITKCADAEEIFKKGNVTVIR